MILLLKIGAVLGLVCVVLACPILWRIWRAK